MKGQHSFEVSTGNIRTSTQQQKYLDDMYECIATREGATSVPMEADVSDSVAEGNYPLRRENSMEHFLSLLGGSE